MKKYSFWLLVLSVICFSQWSYADKIFKNQLLPFVSDGCTGFPNGIPFVNEDKWLHCCVNHDIAYWQGGTQEQRESADLQFQQCVEETGESVVAYFMYLGVSIGGHTGFPTSWRWGYGWKIYRGYKPLSSHDSEQVEMLSKQIPEDLSKVEISSLPIVPTRESVTEDYCLDISIEYIYSFLNSPFSILDIKDNVKESSSGWEKELTIKVLECEDPFTFHFLLLHPRACHIKMNEILARGRIRLQRTQNPNCQVGANILEVNHKRLGPGIGIRQTQIDILIETKNKEHIDKINKNLKKL